MKIDIPNISEQRKFVIQKAVDEGIKELKANQNAPFYDTPLSVDESIYPNTHLLREREGWLPPEPELVRAYFLQFQTTFSEYGTDKKLALLFGLSSDRRVREFKTGEYKVPYGIWRYFLVITGRAPQEIISVLGYFS